MKRFATVLLLAACTALAGCGYYRVTDPTTSKTYYTRSDVAWRYGWTGTVRFHDWISDRDVTLHSSEIEKISRQEFEAATGRHTETR